MPLRPRHSYAVAIHRGLPTGDINQSESSPPDSLGRPTGARRNPAHICQIRAGGMHLRSVQTLVHSRYTFRSRSPDPHHLAVLARPGVVRAALHPPRRPPVQAALSFTRPAATGQKRCPFITARFKSASWRSMSPHHFSSGAAAPKSRPRRSGALRALRSALVRPRRRCLALATRPWRAIDAATVFSDTRQPASRRSAKIRGDP